MKALILLAGVIVVLLVLLLWGILRRRRRDKVMALGVLRAQGLLATRLLAVEMYGGKEMVVTKVYFLSAGSVVLPGKVRVPYGRGTPIEIYFLGGKYAVVESRP